MKYTWRISSILILILSSIIFKVNVYLTLGYLPPREWIITIVFAFPVWWLGLQFDKLKYFAQQVKTKDDEKAELFQSLDAVIYSYDLRTNHLMMSSKITELCGYSPKDFKDNKHLWEEIVYIEDIEIVEYLKQRCEKGETGLAEYRIQLPSGDIRWIQKRLTPILDADGKVIKINGIDIDIDSQKKVEALLSTTQEQNRKLLEKRLDETEQRFKSLFVHHSDSIFTFNLDGDLIETNQAAEQLNGYTLDELKSMDWESIIVSNDREMHRKCFKYALNGKNQECTLSIIHKDGGERIVSLKMVPIFVDNQLIGIYEIAKDITETRLAEEMIRRSDKLSVVGQLAAGVAHEIRNPLTTLTGFVQLFKKDIDEQYVNIMLSELNRINLIVSEFLILSKPQAIKHEYKDIQQILEDIISFLRPQAIIKNIHFHLMVDKDIPLLMCEENQLKQVFINLIKNSIEAMPNGGIIRIEATLDEFVRIRIIDEGEGIEESQIPKLGEPFFTTKDNGTGLGLMVCFQIIESHGGEMGMTSQVGVGTTTDIKLPIHRAIE